MTRINVVPVTELTQQHLVAEYREISRLPKNLLKSLNRKTKPFCMSEIPQEYVLGKGHVKFFYDKMKWLERRYTELLNEMWDRGYNPQFTDPSIFTKCDPVFYNDYKPTKEALKANRERIKERLSGSN
jgi:deoxyribonuclease (pyrimidine dimer)